MEDIFQYYKRQGAPGDQTALISLFEEVMAENGGAIPQEAIRQAGAFYGVKESFLLAIIHRIPRLKLENSRCLQLCGGPNCSKSRELAKEAEKLAVKNNFSLSYVGCMRMCGKGPNIKWNGEIYHQADPTLLEKLTRK